MSKALLPLEALRLTIEYSHLDDKQRALVDAFVEHHHNKNAAYQSVHPKVKTPKSLISCANRAFSMPAMRAVLDVYFQTPSDPLASVKAVILKASRNKNLTTAQSQMIRLYAAANGIGTDASTEPVSVPAPEPHGRVIVDKVVERDGRKLRQVITDLGAVDNATEKL